MPRTFTVDDPLFCPVCETPTAPQWVRSGQRVRSPDAGSVTVCNGCLQVLVIERATDVETKPTSLRLPTLAEARRLFSDYAEMIRAFQLNAVSGWTEDVIDAAIDEVSSN